jgi:hypothetical protein
MTDRAIPAAPSRVAHFQDQLPDSKIISGQAVHSGGTCLRGTPCGSSDGDRVVRTSTARQRNQGRPASAPDGPTGRIATWVAGLELDDVPPHVRDRASHLMLDGVGYLLVGSHLHWSEIGRTNQSRWLFWPGTGGFES